MCIRSGAGFVYCGDGVGSGDGRENSILKKGGGGSVLALKRMPDGLVQAIGPFSRSRTGRCAVVLMLYSSLSYYWT